MEYELLSGPLAIVTRVAFGDFESQVRLADRKLPIEHPIWTESSATF